MIAKVKVATLVRKLYSQGIVVFQVSNTQVDGKLLTGYYWV